MKDEENLIYTYFLWYNCYSTFISGNIWLELELEPEPELEPKITNFGSATLQRRDLKRSEIPQFSMTNKLFAPHVLQMHFRLQMCPAQPGENIKNIINLNYKCLLNNLLKTPDSV